MHASSTNTQARLLAFIAVLLALFAIKLSAELLGQVLMALFIAIISLAAMKTLCNLGLSRLLARIIIILLVIVFLLSISALVGNALQKMHIDLPVYQEKLVQKTVVLQAWVAEFGFDVTQSGLLNHVQPDKLMAISVGVLQKTSRLFGSAFIVLLATIFFIAELPALNTRLRAQKLAPEIQNSFVLITGRISQYLMIKTMTSALTGLLVFFFLFFLGVDYAILWATAAFLLNYIPNIGSILAMIPPALLAWVQLDALHLLWVVVGYFLINSVIGNALEPKWMGQKLGLSMLAVFLSLLFWGWLLGLIGMFLSIPLTMSVRFFLEAHDKTRPLATFLG